ncbi:MAG TPA: phenylalanine--tRNA ligase subunit beta [Dehalococcoidales bacterium]
MKVSVKWLKDYVDITVTPAELANRLTMAGNEVKAVETTGNWENVVVGQVTAINPHPNADRLRLATVDTGKGQETVVCGAFNFTTGDKIAFASVGAELTDGHNGQKLRLKAAKIRGVESRGMICSGKELGISEDHTGILVLPAEAPVGTLLSDYLGDSIIDLDVTPNRADCLSIIGIARESAALTGQKIHIADVIYAETDVPAEQTVGVEIQAPDLCPRYCASLVTGIKILPSPKWMQDRLTASGMRPINNIVDISNYVMLEYGQPLHTFDFDKIAGKKIVVRRAKEDEALTSLDGIERKLNSKMLVIADAEKAVAVAGVMGGANSEVTDGTTNILLEAASFKATSIHYTGETLGLASESRYRFERGISPGLTIPALRRATQLLAELGGGKIARGWIDAYPGSLPSRPVLLSRIKLQHLLGAEISLEQIVETLTSLGFECQKTDSAFEIEVTTPDWRNDIHIEEDLIEEVVRIRGYDQIPTTLLAEPLPHLSPDPIFDLKRTIRLALAAAGCCEVLNFSLVSLDSLKKLSPDHEVAGTSPIRLANPMTAEAEYLRTTFRGNLLSAFAANRRYEEGSIRLFEVGKVYLARGKELPDERETMCAVIGGLRYARTWQDAEQRLDVFDAKGISEGLLQRLGLNPVFEKGQDLSLHPQKQAGIFLDKTQIGAVGEIHPKVLLEFEITEPVFLIELDLKTLVPFTVKDRLYQPVPRFPSSVRDLALILDAGVTHQSVQKVIKSFSLVEEAEIFDVYAGGQVQAGKKSMAYRISYRSAQNTLTDEEINRVQSQILDRLSSELGAVLRS